MTKDENYISWFYNNYVQLSCNKGSGGSSELNFFRYFMWEHRYPFFHIETLTRDTISILKNDFISLIKDVLISGKYFYVNIDEYYLPLQLYRQEHLVRDVLVFGFDDETNMFQVLGFDKNAKFGVNNVSYKDLHEAYLQTEVLDGWENYIYLVKENPFTYNFNFGLLTELLEDYLHSKNTSKKFNMIDPEKNLHYGLNSLEALKEDIHENNYGFVSLHILWEHKKIMNDRIKYISNILPNIDFKEILYNYEKTQSMAENIRMLCLKSIYKKDSTLNSRMISLLNSIIENEKIILNNLICKINSI